MTTQSSVPGPRHGERGTIMILTAFAFVFIVAIAALAIDLAMVRNDRADNQVAVDSSATAGIVFNGEDGGIVACQEALGYLESVTGYTMTGADCSAFPARCGSSTPSGSTTGLSGALSITITHPVDDGDPLMQPGAIGAPSLTVSEADGDRCGRLGVSLTEVHTTFFGGFFGVTDLTSTVHAVALDGTDRSPARTANLIVLDRHDCNALTATTGSGSGGIRVGAVTDSGGRVYPGRIVVDSDAASGCGPDGTIDIDGINAAIQADGPPGCATEVSPVGSGHGCGVIETFAPGPPGCLVPACSSGGIINPPPVQTNRRITRAPVDHQWNCKPSYPMGYDIDGCFDAGFTPPYIDQLTAAVGPSGVPSGFSSYTSAGHPCNVTPSATLVIPPGNWVVDCPLLVNGSLTFVGGNVIFDNDVTMNADGTLVVNNTNTNSYTWIDDANLDHTDSSADAAYAYFRAGQLSKAGQASVILRSTMVYLAPGTNIKIAGGSGILDWTAPTDGPFKSLALWSDSNVTNDFGGQTNLVMDGVFFAPLATLKYTGNSTQQQVAAQYVVNKLHVSGQGQVTLTPDPAKGIAFPLPWPTVLIR